jgi:hypothetical protein
VCPHADAVYADPARRNAERKLTKPDEFIPPLHEVLNLYNTPSVKLLIIKLPPSIDREIADVWVALEREVVEALIVRKTDEVILPQNFKKVVILSKDGGVFELSGDLKKPADEISKISDISNFIVEPNNAIIRSGLVAVFAQKVGANLIDRNIAYCTLDQVDDEVLDVVHRSFSKLYRVLAVEKINQKILRTRLKQLDAVCQVVKKRGVDIDPHKFIKGLNTTTKCPETPVKHCTIILTRLNSGADSKRLAVICEEVV